MCLWKLLLLGWMRPNSSDSDDCKGGRDLHRQHHTSSSDDDMSDSGISSGEFSLENVCEDSCSPCPVPQPAPPAPVPPVPAPPVTGPMDLVLPVHSAHNDNRQVNVVIYY